MQEIELLEHQWNPSLISVLLLWQDLVRECLAMSAQVKCCH